MINLQNKLTGLRALWRFDNRWQLIFDRLFFQSSVSIYRLGDLEFLIDHEAGDHNGTRLCLISDIYTRFLPMMNLPAEVSVFDLGANGGGFPLMLLLHGKRLRRLACVELNPNTFRRLQYNITRNIPGGPTVINAAVCDTPRQFELWLGRGDISDSIYAERSSEGRAGRQAYLIEGHTFDELFQANFRDDVVDICKMDIEGAEYELMASPEHANLRRCRYLIVEMHSAAAETIASFEQSLERAGFSLLHDGGGVIPGERLYRNTALP